MLGNGHVRFGRRAAETDRTKDRHRAAARPHTYVAAWSGMAFTAFVTDVFSRRIVGWRTAPSMPTELAPDALEMALWTRARAGEDVDGVVHHSDAGSQIHVDSLRRTPCRDRCGALDRDRRRFVDNALAETVNGYYKAELIRGPAREGHPWRTVEDVELATLGWVHWHNHERLHGHQTQCDSTMVCMISRVTLNLNPAC